MLCVNNMTLCALAVKVVHNKVINLPWWCELTFSRDETFVLMCFSPFATVSLCGVAALAETFPSFPVSGPFLPDVPGFQVPPDSVFPSQLWSSSRALPLSFNV